MKVSVCLTTYNHAPHIRQAIEGVLMQKTAFDFEFLIGEDESNDGTREIVREYADRHPEKIRLFLHSRKDVHYVNGKPTGRRNLVNNLKQARGQYLALLEGDDYWTAPDKLQKQADLLDQYPDLALCFHRVEMLRDDGRKQPFLEGQKQDRFTLAEFLDSQCHIHTVSVMLRNGLVRELPEWYWRMPFGDLPLYALHAQHGDIGFIDEIMAVYRIHGGGIWSQGAGLGKWMQPENPANNWRLAGMVDFYEAVNEHLGFKYDRLLRDKISMWCYALVWAYRLQGDRATMKACLRRALRAKVFNSRTPMTFVLKSLLHTYAPFIYSPLNRLKKSTAGGKS